MPEEKVEEVKTEEVAEVAANVEVAEDHGVQAEPVAEVEKEA